MADAGVTQLRGDEDEVWFLPGQEFTGVSEEWLRPRLRLDPATEYVDLDGGSLHVALDDLLLEDLGMDVLLGSGPNDGDLVAVEDPEGRCASARIIGGWMETWAADMAHDLVWVGLDCDLEKVVGEWVFQWALTWEGVEVTFDRTAP